MGKGRHKAGLAFILPSPGTVARPDINRPSWGVLGTAESKGPSSQVGRGVAS